MSHAALITAFTLGRSHYLTDRIVICHQFIITLYCSVCISKECNATEKGINILIKATVKDTQCVS